MTKPVKKVALGPAAAAIDGFWTPKLAGNVNGTAIKLAKFQGAFDWHFHEKEDEAFIVLSGRMRMGLRDGDIDLDVGEMIIIPAGVEHCPQALSEPCHVMMIEPETTLNTGNLVNERTVAQPGNLP